MDPERRLDRRSLLLAGAGLLVAGSACDADVETPRPQRRTTSSPSQSTATSASQSPGPSTAPSATPPASGSGLPVVEAWTPDAGDLQPGVKLAAARVVEAIGTWPAGQSGADHAARRLRALGQHGRWARDSYPPLSPRAEAATLQVIEAQYGGLLPTTASVLVVCRQWLTDEDGRGHQAGTTVDVRLTRDSPHWRVTALHPGALRPPARPLSTLARAVLAEPRIDLPPAARADVSSGAAHDSVLTAMLRLARSYRIGVSVVRSGHPTDVFGTDRVSDHAQGRAFDTWQIDGHRVVDPATPRSLVTGYMEAAAAAGSYNIGGPYLLAGGTATFFSDATHHDHVHMAFAT